MKLPLAIGIYLMLFCGLISSAEDIKPMLPKVYPVEVQELGVANLTKIGSKPLYKFVGKSNRQIVLSLENYSSLKMAQIKMRVAYAKQPDDDELYFALNRADAKFRHNQLKVIPKASKIDNNEKLRRGMTVFNCVIEWYSIMDIVERDKMLKYAQNDLEAVWKEKPSNICGAALLDVYEYSREKSLGKGFFLKFLHFVDPEYSYKLYQQAKANNFTRTELDWSEVPKESRLIVSALFGTRWSETYHLQGHGKENDLMKIWYRSIPKEDNQ